MEEVDRAKTLYKMRTAFGWDAALVAKLLDVTPRTVGLWETGDQPIPDARWRLFLHEARNAIERAAQSEGSMVVVLANDGLTPIDVVSDKNFVSFERDGDVGTIASYAIDRVTKQPTVHHQRFRCSVNKHVVAAAERWEAVRRAAAPGADPGLLALLHWLARRTLAAEQANPQLRRLKDAIAAATREVEAACSGPESVLKEKLAAQDRAIHDLIKAVQDAKPGAGE